MTVHNFSTQYNTGYLVYLFAAGYDATKIAASEFKSECIRNGSDGLAGWLERGMVYEGGRGLTRE